MKRLLALLLTLALVCTLLCVPAAAVEFSDLPTNHWAYGYMQNLYARGIFTGYIDGTIRPDISISVVQVLALLARYYDVSDDALSDIMRDYGTQVAAVLPTAATWAEDEIAVCLAAGIVSFRELAAYSSLTQDISREDFSVFLVRTMQLEDEAYARSYASLSFKDVEDISSDALFHIDLLVSLGIINGLPDGSFSPAGSTTRAAVAKMISLSLYYLEARGITLEVPGYADRARTSGLLTGFDASSLSVTFDDGLTRRFSLTAGSVITVNDTAAALDTAYLGSRVRVIADGNNALRAEITYSVGVSYLQGRVLYCSSSAQTGDYVAIESDGQSLRCPVTAATVYTRDDRLTAAYSTLTTGDFVTVRLENGFATSVSVTAPAESLAGTILLLSYTAQQGLLLVTDAEGAVWSFPVDYNAMPMILIGGAVSSPSALSTGDPVSLTIRYGDVTSIVRESVSAEYLGVLNTISQSLTGTQWTLQCSDGSIVTAPLSSAAVLREVDGTAILAGAVSVGDTLAVLTSDGVITSVVRTGRASVSGAGQITSVRGAVLNSGTGGFLALIDGAAVTVSTVSALLQNTLGGSVLPTAIVSGSTFLAYGVYADTGTFHATLVIFD